MATKPMTLRLDTTEIAAIDEECQRRGWTRTQLVRRLLERASLIPEREVRVGRPRGDAAKRRNVR